MAIHPYRQEIKRNLEKQFNLTADQIDSMIPGMIATLASHMENLEKAFEADDLVKLGKAGHTMKGALLNLGLNECAQIAFDIEQNGKSEENSVDYHMLVTTLRKKLDPYIT